MDVIKIRIRHPLLLVADAATTIISSGWQNYNLPSSATISCRCKLFATNYTDIMLLSSAYKFIICY